MSPAPGPIANEPPICRIEERLPTLEEYKRLCESVGWGQIMNFRVAERAIERSVCGAVCLDEQDQAIAMGRIVGDGAIYFYIQDIVVAPQHQHRGIGTRILNRLFDYIRHHAPPKSFIGLFSTPDAVEFYRKFTLEQRDLIGLFTVKEIVTEAAEDPRIRLSSFHLKDYEEHRPETR